MEEKKEKKPYEKPAIVFEQKIEVLAGACGSSTDEKATFMGQNPTYSTPCEYVHS